MTSKLPEEELFHRARKISSREERVQFVADHCGENPSLRDRVLAMLDVFQNESDYLEVADRAEATKGGHEDSSLPGGSFETTGESIGRFKLREQVGEGGMGVVYVAEQTKPVARKVALKVIKPGMDSRQVVARFEAERQALAMMDHPNIARVLDAGTTESGRPYFAMDLVRGLPITKYCEKHKLDTTQRLQLLIDVCHAVQHAHQKGIIHRDLKPSNVLVTRMGDRAIPKVIDFGLAKAMGQQLTDKSIYTQFHQLVGTPLYMSPEQAEMSAYDVDTRSDVYSLGVMLYELLTGETPIERSRLSSVSYDELRRIVREEVPQRPSDRVTTMAIVDDSTVNANRQTELSSSRQTLRGELDWITLKSLEKDAARRYQSASDFANDIQRYLDGDAVEACPPSLTYKAIKFAQKHRVAMVAASLVTVSMVLGVVSSLVYANHARIAAVEANDARSRADEETTRAFKIAEERDRFAEEQKREATRAKEAEQEQRKLREQADQAKYRYSIRLAQSLQRRGDDAAALQTLKKVLPVPGRSFQPDWAWYFLLGQNELSERQWKAHDVGMSVSWIDRGNQIITTGFTVHQKRNDGLYTIPSGKLWRARSGDLLQSIPGWFGRLDWNENAGVLGNIIPKDADDGSEFDGPIAQVLNLESMQLSSVPLPIENNDTRAFVFHPEGDRFACRLGGSVSLWSIKNEPPTLLRKIRASVGVPCGWNGSGELFAMVSGNGKQLHVYEGDGETLTARIDVDVQNGPIRAEPGRWHPNRNVIALPLPASKSPVIIDADQRKVIVHLGDGSVRVNALAWSPDGRWLAAASQAGEALIWETNNFGLTHAFKASTTYLSSIAWSPDSKRLVCLGVDGLVSVWPVDRDTDEDGHPIPIDGSATAFCWYDSETIRYSDPEGSILDFDLSKSESLSVLEGSPEDSWKLVGRTTAWKTIPRSESLIPVLRQIDQNKTIQVDRLVLPSDQPLNWAVSRDGLKVAVRQSARNRPSPKTLLPPQVVDLNSLTITSMAMPQLGDGQQNYPQMSFSSDGSRLAMAGLVQFGGFPGVVISSTDSAQGLAWTRLGKLDRRESAQAVSWSPDDTSVLATTPDGRSFVIDARDGSIEGSIRAHSTLVSSLQWHPSDQLVASGGTKRVAIWDPRSFEVLLEFAIDHPIRKLAWSPDGSRLAALDGLGFIRVWDCRRGKERFMQRGAEFYGEEQNANTTEELRDSFK